MIYRFLFALVLLLLVGCQKETIELEDDFRPNPDGSVAFRLQIEDSEIDNSGSATKGTPQNGLAEYDSVCVNIYSHVSTYEATTGNDVRFFQKVRLEKGDLTLSWKSTPPLFWPVPVPKDTLLSFFAYALDTAYVFDAAKAAPLAGLDTVVSFSPSTGVPDSIVYKVPSDVTRQPDLLVSALFNQSKTDNISLTMKHALACVSFVGTAPEAGTFVKSITLRNVYGKGALALDAPTIAWTVYPDSKDFTVYEAGIKTDEELQEEPQDNNYLMTANGYLMMIPQKLTNAAIDVLYWNGKNDTANKMITYLLPTDDESYATWRPGKKYIYKFGTQSEDITVVYYEKYADASYGLYYDQDNLKNSIRDDKAIEEAGYGVLSKEKVGSSSVLPIRLTATSSTPVTSGNFVELTDGFLYPVNQTGAETFTLPTSSTPVDVYFNGSSQSCGMIVPHFAKGVYTVKTAMREHAIRTPQQMRNITALGLSSAQEIKTYTQELNLDFLKEGIGGGELATSVVACGFNDVFEGQGKRIENVTIKATTVNAALFLSNSGDINNVQLLNSSISSSGNTGGITATNESDGVITYPRIIGENVSTPLKISGSLYVGAIAGLNYGQISGSTDLEVATELPVAEVSGWVNIEGINQPVGGVTGENRGTITTCLVNGVHVTGTEQGNVTIAKINIKGGNYVGGIVGVNRKTVVGNYSGSGITLKTEPDVAGLVSILGNDFVGGIAGQNEGVLNQVNIRLGRGSRTDATTITGKASVGGIVGYNTNGGVLKADGNSFISVRGNVHITGTSNVGGIVGNNQSGNISNCFVYNFYSQTSPLEHYAPKISGTTLVGGIVGYAGNNANITNCAVFSTVSDANKDAGEKVADATVEIISTGTGAGGIVGRGFSGLTLSANYVLGNVNIKGESSDIGGIMGANSGADITSVHIGNSGPEVSNIYTGLFDIVKLPVRDPRMKTGGNVMTATSGTPTITGENYIGGIVGLNDGGTIKNINLNDNVKIGRKEGLVAGDGSNWVGGIAGGNTAGSKIENCKVFNSTGRTVAIQGSLNLGGIAGISNGAVQSCSVYGSPDNYLEIKGLGKIGGIVGQLGGHAALPATPPHWGNDNTTIKDCTVPGYVTLEGYINKAYGSATDVGGIAGLTGPNKNEVNGVESCVVGKTAAVIISVDGAVGGIVGTSNGNIVKCDVYNTTITSTSWHENVNTTSPPYAGGIVGVTVTRSKTFNNPESTYCSDIKDCRIYTGVNIESIGYGTHNPKHAGALVGYINSTVTMRFGLNAQNLVSNIGVKVNQYYTPVNEDFIVGFATDAGGTEKTTINHNVQAITPR